MIDVELIRLRYAGLSPHLDERGRRLFAATEARAAGHGGIVAVSRATGIARSTIGRGLRELDEAEPLELGWVRREGGGRKTLVASNPGLLGALLALVRPTERGDPMSPLRWTCLSLRQLEAALKSQGHPVSHTVVGALLKGQGFSLQANRKTLEGSSHPDRDAQFGHISKGVSRALAEGQPVISVDTKKKELVGPFRNAGREWRPQGTPEEVRVHDFLIEELGRAVPYGVYDLAANTGWVSVGVDHDTAAFAVQTIRRWWQDVGRPRYPRATRLVITADGGGSNGSRVRLWKRELQRLADELGLEITVHHLPPGTSKWNKIEHRLFSYISQNWRAKPLVSYRTIVNLIGATTTKTGLTVRCELDPRRYPKGIRVSDEDIAALNIHRDPFHGEWNYTLDRNLLGWCCWCEGAGEAELGDLLGEPLGVGFGRGASEVVWPEVLVEGAIAQHVVGGGEDGGCDGADGLLGSTAVAQALELGLQVAGLLACGGPGALDQRRLEPGCSVAQAVGAALAGALVVARAQPGPGDQVACGGEPAHVGADLGDDDLGGQVTDAGDGAQQLDRLAERVQAAVHLRVDLGQGGVERVDLAQVQPQQEPVPVGDAPGQRRLDPLGRRLDAFLHQGKQPFGVGLLLDQRLDDRPPAFAHDVGQHRAELDVGVFQRLLQPLHVAGLLAHQLLARAQQGAHLLRRRLGHKARADQAVRQQVGQPDGVGYVGLAAGHVLDVCGIGQDERDLAV